MLLLSRHPLVFSLLLITAASPVASAVKAFETKDDLQAAVDSYCADAFDDESTYGSIENWDVSKITSMNSLFRSSWQNQKSCNPNIGSWDVSKVTNFQSMFNNARAFNKDISNWDVSSGTNFNGMFYKADAFNQDVSTWDVSSGIYFSAMFNQAVAFNQPQTYCKLQQSNSKFHDGVNVCSGSISCGWGQTDCPATAPPTPFPTHAPTATPTSVASADTNP
uniref:BspA family leucine-rich repeat surface protein n=1 Tax=Chaetoceros debilis TaxID=122233 RepID=A0A7S3QIK2_9STRA